MSQRSRPNWIRSGGSYGSCGAVWNHTSGATVFHCGHATALWPYYGQLANGTLPTMITEEDHGGPRSKKPKKGEPFVPKFQHLAECQAWIEEQQEKSK